ncbi:hypothetical protein CYY_005048 [Polysphondylium violaceum]|uniref:Monalysin Pore-forming domain-containing protein n=1 Tax=Polysphondylium violaceum TaxID=133409 RepID=A0A8J4PX64_9MYCE|nr:hypothetical protein CYY_005048 [Polysphondylium violaceum]
MGDVNKIVLAREEILSKLPNELQEKIKPQLAFRNFDMTKCQTAKNNMEISAITSSQEYPEPMCKFYFPTSSFVSFGLDVICKPVACYLDFIGNKVVPYQDEYTLTKKKGSTVINSMSTEVTASASAGIFGCEVSMSVTTGYNYSKTITEEVTETWKQTLNEGDYYTYQNYMLYVYNIVDADAFNFNDWAHKVRDNFGETIYTGKNGKLYFFLPVFRDDAFTKRYKEDFYSTVSRVDLKNFLMNEGFNNW